jgi:hypothetical protein
MMMSLGQVGVIFAIPVFLQGVRGFDSLHTGYALLPLSIALVIAAPLSGALLTGKFAPKHIIQTGLMINILALVVLRLGLGVHSTAWSVAPGLALYGLGMGIGMAQISNLTLSAVAVDEAGEASGVNNTLRQIGSSLGSAIIGAVLLTTLATQLQGKLSNSTILPLDSRGSIAREVSSQASAVEFGSQFKSTETLTTDQKSEIKLVADASTVSAARLAMIYTIGFTALALAVSTQLPSYMKIERHESPAPGAH